MSKLINLSKELAIPAGSILTVTGCQHNGVEWYCVIAYKVFAPIEYFSYHFNNTLVTTEDKANERRNDLINRINNLL